MTKFLISVIPGRVFCFIGISYEVKEQEYAGILEWKGEGNQ